jgi:hypothetical protein
MKDFLAIILSLLITTAYAHLCLYSPRQRGPFFNNDIAQNECFRPKVPVCVSTLIIIIIIIIGWFVIAMTTNASSAEVKTSLVLLHRRFRMVNHFRFISNRIWITIPLEIPVTFQLLSVEIQHQPSNLSMCATLTSVLISHSDSLNKQWIII